MSGYRFLLVPLLFSGLIFVFVCDIPAQTEPFESLAKVPVKKHPADFWGLVIASDDDPHEIAKRPRIQPILPSTIGSFETSAVPERYQPRSEGIEVSDLEGHSGAVLSLKFSDNGEYLLSGSVDKTAILWDIRSGTEKQRFRNHKNHVSTVAMNRDANTILSASKDKTGFVWRPPSPQALYTFKSPKDNFTGADMNLYGTLLAIGSDKGPLMLWRSYSGNWESERVRLYPPFNGHTKAINSVSFDSLGLNMVSASSDRTAMIWKTNGNEQTPSLVFSGHNGTVLCAEFSKDGSMVISGSSDKTAIVWNSVTGTNISILDGHEGDVVAVGFNREGTLAATASKDSTIKFWEVATGKCVKTVQSELNSISVAVFHVNLESVAVCETASKTIRLIRNPTVGIGNVERNLVKIPEIVLSEETIARIPEKSDHISWPKHAEDTTDALFSRDDSLIATTSLDGTVFIYDAKTRQKKTTLEGSTQKLFRCGTFTPDSQSFLAGLSDGSIMIWNKNNGSITGISKRHSFGVNSIALAPNGVNMLSCSSDGSVILWDFKQEKMLKKFTLHSSSVNAGVFSPNGMMYATCSTDRLVILYDLKKQAPIHTLRGHASFVNDVDFSPDGKFVISGDQSGTVILWNAETGQAIKKYKHPYPVGSVKFYPVFLTTALIMVGTEEGAFGWNLRTDTPVRAYRKHPSPISRVRFNNEGTRMFLCGGENATLWDVSDLQSIISR